MAVTLSERRADVELALDIGRAVGFVDDVDVDRYRPRLRNGSVARRPTQSCLELKSTPLAARDRDSTCIVALASLFGS